MNLTILGCPHGHFGLKFGCQKQFYKNMAQGTQNVAKMSPKWPPQGRLWDHIGALKGMLGRPWAQFACHFGCCVWYFVRFLTKSVILEYRCPSAVELLLLAVWASKLELLGRKSRQKSPQTGKSEGSGQSSQTGRSGLAVGAMEPVAKNPRIKSRQGTKSI